jgi:IclR family transcriptional regulator, blcABC operon repressor
MPLSPVAQTPTVPPDPGSDRRGGGGGQVVPSVLRAVAVMNALAANPAEATLASLSKRLELPRSSTLSLCNSLVRTGLLERVAGGGYRLGPHVLELSRAFLRQTDLHTEFRRALAERLELNHETVVCSVLQGSDAVYIGSRPGSQRIGVSYELGLRLPAHCTASGLAMLARLTADQAAALYESSPEGRLEILTPHSIATLPDLLARLEHVRVTGYAVDDEETAQGMLCIGVAIDHATDRGAGAVAVSVLKGGRSEAELTALTREVQLLASEISAGLGAPGS